MHDAAGDDHHVASPLGAWLLLALCARAADGARREQFESILGMDVAGAAGWAERLLQSPHPAIARAAALWTHPDARSPRFNEFASPLPAAVSRGDIPDQAALDAWARDNTLGLIDRFPDAVGPLTTLILATALTTRVEWYEHFELCVSKELGQRSDWSRRVRRALRTPSEDRHAGHMAFIAPTRTAGDVAVHAAWAKEGLVVVSVIADASVSRASVMDVAYDLAPRIARGEAIQPRSLFDLPVGDAALWTIAEIETQVAGQSRELHTSIMPSWEASTTSDLMTEALGFPSAALALAALSDVPLAGITARQATIARYYRSGLEAAVVSRMSLTRGFAIRERMTVRHAVLRFGQPYAVVAVAAPSRYDNETRDSAWNGIPVFSAWVCQPAETEEEEKYLDYEELDFDYF